MSTRWFTTCAALTLLTLPPAVACGEIEPSAATWPQWRGPSRNGLVAAPTCPPHLSEDSLEKLWSEALGPSYSGPIIANGKVFTTETVEEKIERVSAFDLKTGKFLWKAEWTGSLSVFFIAKANGDWIRATPAYADGKLYVAGMRDLLVCLNAETGEELWRYDFVSELGSELPAFGTVSSPLIDEESVYVQAGQGVCRLDRNTGKLQWRSLISREMYGSAFSSPVMATLAGQKQLVVQTRQTLTGLEFATGQTLWSTPVEAFRGMNILTPTVIGNRIFTSTYGGGSVLYEISSPPTANALPETKPEVSAEENGGLSANKLFATTPPTATPIRKTPEDSADVAAVMEHRAAATHEGVPMPQEFGVEEVWRSKVQGYMTSPLVIDDHVYFQTKNQRLTCLDLKSGETTWTSPPFGKYVSLVGCGSRFLALDERGILFSIAATPAQFEEQERRVMTNSSSWAHLAVTDEFLVIRALDSLLVFRVVDGK